MEDLLDTLRLHYLNYLKLPPGRPDGADTELGRIQGLDVSGFSEADVREEIITPLIRLLGYDKGTVFSLERERALPVLGKHTFIDYNFTLWRENFWLIEAKRPRKKGFGHRDLLQAVQYAAHPQVNAALIVLCDGESIEVFDREINLERPFLQVMRGDLIRDFDKLLAVLAPWQVWFFEKRRAARLIDKIFDKEPNYGRVHEFKAQLSRQLGNKRDKITQNFRDTYNSETSITSRHQYLAGASPEELVDCHFSYLDTVAAMNIVTKNLIDHCAPSSFRIVDLIFPSRPRPMNDAFICYALKFLIELDASGVNVNYLPDFLQPSGQPKSASSAIKALIALCLTYFRSDAPRRSVLLFGAAARRLAKARLVCKTSSQKLGELLHTFERVHVAEDSWAQLVSSPERHLILQIDREEISATSRFVQECISENGRFLLEIAKRKLFESWTEESDLLVSVPEYLKLLNERDFDELHPTEAADVVYDNLGHGALCILVQYPRWKAYVMADHRAEVEALATIGSWQARKWLGMDRDTQLAPPTANFMADRFFFGDVVMFERLAARYGYSTDGA